MSKKRTVSDDYIERCKAYTESVKVSIESAKSYLNFVLLIGYGSFFGIWKLMEDELTREQRFWAALLMSASLAIFVLWEVVRMYWSGIQTMIMAFRARHWIDFTGSVVWFLVFNSAFVFALLAISILFIAFGEGLYSLYQNP